MQKEKKKKKALGEKRGRISRKCSSWEEKRTSLFINQRMKRGEEVPRNNLAAAVSQLTRRRHEKGRIRLLG